MPLFEIKQDGISRLGETTFSTAGLRERQDLQRLLRAHIEVIAPQTLVISEEFGDWTESKRRIDLLAIDKEANLVVIELKRTEDGGHMELQAIRYAAMVSSMTFDKAVEVYGDYLKTLGADGRDARSELLEFLEWEEPSDDKFAQDVVIVLASAEFSREITSSVLWLNDHGIDIRCVRLKPYHLDGRILVDVQQIIPLPEAQEYQVQIREKSRLERHARTSNMDFTRFDVDIGAESHSAMWKRNAIFAICRYLVKHGVVPEDIGKLIDWRPNRVWYTVDGLVTADEYKNLASAKAADGGPGFSSNRWFCEEDDLIVLNGKTYAFSNQWGGPNWYRAMNLLKEKYSQFNISFAASSTG